MAPISRIKEVGQEMATEGLRKETGDLNTKGTKETKIRQKAH
jgi:hypothetical protein